MALLDDSDLSLIESVTEVIRKLPNHGRRSILKLLPPPYEIPSFIADVELLVGVPLFGGNQLQRKFLIEALKSMDRPPTWSQHSTLLDLQDQVDIQYFETKTGAPFRDLLELPNPIKALRFLDLQEHEKPFVTRVYLRLVVMLKKEPESKRPIGFSQRPIDIPIPSPQPTPAPYSDEGVQPGTLYVNALGVKPAAITTPFAIPPKTTEVLCVDKALCMMGTECKLKHTPEERKYFGIRDKAVENGFAGDFVKTSICIHWDQNKCFRDKQQCFFAHGAKDTLCRECKLFGKCTCV